MIEEDVPMDKHHYDFYEKIMEQRIQKVNKPAQCGMEDSVPLPIEPLRTSPVALPQKPVSNTSSDSGFNFPRVLSAAMPITPDNSQPLVLPSTSRMPQSRPLTPIQQFIKNSRNSKTKEPKNNRSQPDHPDSQWCSEPAPDKAINSNFSIFILFSRDILILVTHKLYTVFHFSTLFHITCSIAIKFSQSASGKSQLNGILWVSTQLS